MSESIERVDPSTLIIAANVRTETKISKEFVASIKQHGVKVPITVQRVDEGLAVIDGQRRTLAAVDAGAVDVPVFVVEPLSDEKVRIVDQLIVNDQRESLGVSESVAAVKQLELFGMTAAAIAKKTGYQRKVVDVALQVGGNDVAAAAIAEHDLTLDQAAVLLEFEGHPAIVADLIVAATQGRGFEHTAQRHRDYLEHEARLAAVAEEIREKGLALIDSAPGYEDKTMHVLEHVYASEKGRERLTLEMVLEQAPQDLFAYPERRYGAWTSEGGREPDTYGIGYAVTHLAENGWWIYGMGETKVPLTDEEKAAKKAERETTKDWTAASTVRRAWLHELLQRKTLPKGWELLAAAHVIETSMASYAGGHWMAIAELLDLEQKDAWSMRGVATPHLQQHPARAPQILLGLALGGIEGGFDFDKKGWQAPDTARPYLVTLQGWGYELSDVEARVAGIEEAAAA
jgi:ParB family chromosome partitioning protein